MDGDRFWYRVDLRDGKNEAWQVDARTGVKSPYARPDAAEGSTLRPRFPERVRSEGGQEETEVLFERVADERAARRSAIAASMATLAPVFAMLAGARV